MKAIHGTCFVARLHQLACPSIYPRKHHNSTMNALLPGGGYSHRYSAMVHETRVVRKLRLPHSTNLWPSSTYSGRAGMAECYASPSNPVSPLIEKRGCRTRLKYLPGTRLIKRLERSAGRRALYSQILLRSTAAFLVLS